MSLDCRLRELERRASEGEPGSGERLARALSR